MDLGLRDKVALVAASSHGLGYAIAQELAAEGAGIVMCARGEKRLTEAAREIASSTGARVVPVAADVAGRATSRASSLVRSKRSVVSTFS